MLDKWSPFVHPQLASILFNENLKNENSNLKKKLKKCLKIILFFENLLNTIQQNLVIAIFEIIQNGNLETNTNIFAIVSNRPFLNFSSSFASRFNAFFSMIAYPLFVLSISKYSSLTSASYLSAEKR
jgi:hypothetical protein